MSPSALIPSSDTYESDVWLQDLYQLPKTPAFNKKNTLLVTGYGEQWAQESDLKVRNLLIVRAIAAVPNSLRRLS
jgi:hypothetical protein